MAALSASLRALSLLVLSAVLFVGGRVQAQPTHTTTDTIEVDPSVEVEAHAFRGRVEVSTWDRSAVRLRAEIAASDSGSGAAPAVQVVQEADTTLSIRPNGKTVDSPGVFTVLDVMTWGRDGPVGPKTAYSVRVPADASVTLNLDAADAVVSGVKGEVRFKSVSSVIEVRDVRGPVFGGTLSGTLHAEGIRDELRVGTFSGDLRARLSAFADDLHVYSYTGDADITLPADAAFDLKTDITWGGGVASEFSLPSSPGREDGAVPIGGGGPTVFFDSFSGSLTLNAE
jgi:hypothetical protein